ncbi:MAG: hypothetical protein AAFQ27_14575, partial [Pseudomonadota bacterium]
QAMSSKCPPSFLINGSIANFADHNDAFGLAIKNNSHILLLQTLRRSDSKTDVYLHLQRNP